MEKVDDLRERVSNIVERVVPWAVFGLSIWLLQLYAWRTETERRLAEIERQNIRIWESIDQNKKERELAQVQEWIRIVEPVIMGSHIENE